MQIFIPVTIPWDLFVLYRYKTFCIFFVNYLFNQNILFSIASHNKKKTHERTTYPLDSINPNHSHSNGLLSHH